MKGKQKHQKLFEFLYKLSLSGMNIGNSNGADMKVTGEMNALIYIKNKLSNVANLTIFDAGANTGTYAATLNDIYGGCASIYAFEPSSITFKKLTANIAGIPSIKVFRLGFGSKETKQLLHTNADESGLASLYKRRLDHYNIKMEKSEEVVINTIDTFCSKAGINHIHFLKLDIEGHELEALKGASGLIASDRIDYIQFEFGGCNIDSRTYFQDYFYLLKDNFHIYRILKDGLYKVDQYKEMYEAFHITNFLAERKNL